MRISHSILTSSIASAMNGMPDSIPAKEIYDAMYVMLMGFYKLNTLDPRGNRYLLKTLRSVITQSWRKDELLPIWLAHWNKLYPKSQRSS